MDSVGHIADIGKVVIEFVELSAWQGLPSRFHGRLGSGSAAEVGFVAGTRRAMDKPDYAGLFQAGLMTTLTPAALPLGVEAVLESGRKRT
jgi:hypothetical protein